MTWRGRSASEWMSSLSSDEPSEANQPATEAQLDHLMGLIEAPAGRRRPPTLLVAGASSAFLAAAASAAIFWGRAPEPPREVTGTLVAHGRSRPYETGHRGLLSPGDALEVGREISGDTDFSLRLKGGEEVLASGGATLSLTEADATRGVVLKSGSVEFRIPKKLPGLSFVVSTPTTRVTVVGTAFLVQLEDQGGEVVTCVAVSEGRVRVDSGARSTTIGPGEWFGSDSEQSSVCAPPALPAKDPAVPSPAPLPQAKPESRVGSPVEASKSSLAEENALFLRILRAEREGRDGEADQLRLEFLRKYPSSPLSPRVRETSTSGRN